MGTYVHLGRNAATIWASEEYSFPLKLASVISVVIVTACLSPNVSVDIALLSEVVPEVVPEVMPEVVPEVVQEVVPEVMQEVVPEVMPWR